MWSTSSEIPKGSAMRSTPTAQVDCGHRERHQSARGTRPVSIYAGDRWDGWLGHDRRTGGGVSGAWRYRELGDAGWAWVLGSRGESHRSARRGHWFDLGIADHLFF